MTDFLNGDLMKFSRNLLLFESKFLMYSRVHSIIFLPCGNHKIKKSNGDGLSFLFLNQVQRGMHLEY